MAPNQLVPAPVSMSNMAAMDMPPADANIAVPAEPRRMLVPQIHGYGEAFRKRQELIATKDARMNTNHIGMPVDNHHRQLLAQRLWDAMFNLVNVAEATTSQHYKYFADLPGKEGEIEQHYPSEVVEVMVWMLLCNLEDAQRGVCRIPFWYTTEGPTYKAYASFDERFNHVEDALRQSKSCCCSLFSFTEFAARLAWNPQKEFKRKASNRQLNSIKNNIQTVGSQVVNEYDNGKKYTGKKKIQAARAAKKGGISKRTLPSGKSELARRFALPEMREKLEKEIASIEGDPSTSSGSQTLNASSHGSNEIDVYDSQTSLDLAAHTTPALPIQDRWAFMGPPIPMGTPVHHGQHASSDPSDKKNQMYGGMPGNIMNWANTVENSPQDGYPTGVAPLVNNSQQHQAACQSHKELDMSSGVQEKTIPDEPSLASNTVLEDANRDIFKEQISLYGLDLGDGFDNLGSEYAGFYE
ncbi:hypothetical protein F4782DRAFT_534389 [Xylaria castorea]|nr:hypothetical protein F4782DRAFT_534389 [Xylaria castorea]